jgi:fumarate hydratase class II
VENWAAVLTTLVERIRYRGAQQIIEAARAEGGTMKEVAVTPGVLSAEEFGRLTSPENVLHLGSPGGFGEATPQNAT